MQRNHRKHGGIKEAAAALTKMVHMVFVSVGSVVLLQSHDEFWRQHL